MPTDRFVVLGLADVRSTWFRDLARWATAAVLPLEFVKAMSADEVRVRLAAGRPYSALLVDDSLPGLDRDLILEATEVGCTVITVSSGRSAHRWTDHGAAGTLPATFSPQDLAQMLVASSKPIGDPTGDAAPRAAHASLPGYRGHLVAVTGAGGTGASTVAMALAQDAAVHPAGGPGGVCLADLALDAELAMLHASPDVVPGITELVDAHRAGTPSMESVRSLTWDVSNRHYHLLLGLRRHRDWTSLRPRSVDAAIDSLRRCFRLVLADIEPDLEGERDTGSTDIEDRNLLARRAVAAASVVVVVGGPDMKGIHGLTRVVRNVRHAAAHAVVLPVVNRAPRSPAARAEITRAIGTMLGPEVGVPSPAFLRDRRSLPAVVRDVEALPAVWSRPVTRAVLAHLESPSAKAAPSAAGSEPVPVRARIARHLGRPGRAMKAGLSPLEEIEVAVQARAKDISLEMNGDDGADKLLGLIHEEVARWDAEFQRGRRPFALAQPEVVVERAYRNLARYGPLTPLLEDDDVWEVMVNSPHSIFVKRHSRPSEYHDEVFHDDDHVLRTLTKILDDSSGSHRKLDPTEGLQDAQLDDGARLHIVHGDVSRGGHVMVNIRRFTGVPFRHLDELVGRGMLTSEVASFLAGCVTAGLSMIVAGAPGSGKTTLLSCCTAGLDPSLRVVVAEEVFELDIPVPNVASMQTRAARPERPGVSLRKLVSGFMRMAPDVAVVGEVRDQEALPLLLALSSGVTGFTTIHAGSARQALSRLRFLCQLSEHSTQLPISALNTLVSETVDVVVHCARGDRGPTVNEVIAIEDLTGPADASNFTATQVFERTGPDQSLRWSGAVPVRAARAFTAAGIDVRDMLSGGASLGGLPT